jgi:hypothetical protein
MGWEGGYAINWAGFSNDSYQYISSRKQKRFLHVAKFFWIVWWNTYGRGPISISRWWLFISTRWFLMISFHFLETWTLSFAFLCPYSWFQFCWMFWISNMSFVCLPFFWIFFMLYVLGTSHFIIKKTFLRGPKWKEETQDIFHQCFIHHSSLYNLKLLLLMWDIWFNAHCSQLTTQALAFSLESHRCSPSLLILLHKITHSPYWPYENMTLILIPF